MSLRFKSLSAAFGISITLWVVLIQGGLSLYQVATGGDMNEQAVISNTQVTQPAG
jgi:multisubunit Na+/H+ antiporter MnhF subunit